MSVAVLNGNPLLDEFTRRLRELDLLVSARLDGIILGTRFGLFFVGIDSAGKVEQIAGSIRYSDYVMKDFAFDRDTSSYCACRILDKSRELCQDLLSRRALMRNRAYENRVI